MANIEVFYSKKSDDWKTPSNLYKAFMNNGYIDPCPYQSEFNGLEKDYKGQYLFINPPFSKMEDWIDYGIKQLKNNVSVVFLIPARTDTKYFHKLIENFPKIYFIKGRLHYNDSEKNAPFPSLLIVLNHRLENRYCSITTEEIIERMKWSLL